MFVIVLVSGQLIEPLLCAMDRWWIGQASWIIFWWKREVYKQLSNEIQICSSGTSEESHVNSSWSLAEVNKGFQSMIELYFWRTLRCLSHEVGHCRQWGYVCQESVRKQFYVLFIDSDEPVNILSRWLMNRCIISER